jgi:Cu2+-containing amine oxidase
MAVTLAFGAMSLTAGFWKWNFAATRHKDTETHSSSAFSQSDLARPPNSLCDYIDGDSIRRKDVVVWVNSGRYHIPSAEDAPVTPTSNPVLGFSLL